ncbi:MAG: hypothetical protein KC496_01980 [Anaerolineae bacterium]|nr:hypothetical protein [Anaerolineae bacterium]
MSDSTLVDWLLAAETPTIRYVTARYLLNLPEHDPQVQAAKQAIMTEGAVPAIFANQTETGQWANEHSYYTPKYVSTHWSMMLLTELHVDPTDERFQRGADYMLSAVVEQVRQLTQQREHKLACLWGNILRYVLHAGKEDDPRTQALIEYGIHDLLDGHCPCPSNSNHDCAWGVVRMLWGAAAIPEKYQTPPLQQAVQHSLTFLLEDFQLMEANYPVADDGKIHKLWSRLSFPLMYQVDTLFTLRVLAELRALEHPGAAAALDWLETKRTQKGNWQGGSPYRARTWAEIGGKEETNRWISLHAAMVLQQAGRISE